MHLQSVILFKQRAELKIIFNIISVNLISSIQSQNSMYYTPEFNPNSIVFIYLVVFLLTRHRKFSAALIYGVQI